MIKKLMLLVVFLLLLAGAAVLLAPALIPAETVKAQLMERVRDATGRSMTIDGRLSVKLFPFIGVEAEQVTLSNPEGFGTEPFLRVGALQVNVALLPLLKKDIQVDRFVLRDPVIRLAVNRAGRGNWEFRPAQATAAPGDAPGAPAAAAAGLKGLRLSAIEIRNGALYYADAAGGKQALEQLDATLSLRDIAAPLEVAASALWQGRQVKARLSFDSLQSAAAGKPSAFTADVAGEAVQIKASGTLAGDTVRGKASVVSPSLKRLAAWLAPQAPPMATPATLALEARADVACSGRQCALDALTLALDAIRATGRATVSLAGAVPKLELRLKAGVLDVNPFLAAASTAVDPLAALFPLISEAHAIAPRWSTETIDLSGLRAADVDAVVETTGITFRQFRIGATALNATVKGGRLSAAIRDAALYDGTGSMTLSAEAEGRYGLDAALTGIALEPLLRDAAGMDRLSGRADIRLASSAQGRSQAQIISSLAGKGSFSVADGRMKRVNLLELLRNIGTGGAGDTAFSQMGGSFTLSRGILSNSDLLLVMPGLRVKGEGVVNLPDYTIQYRLTPQTYSTPQAAGGTMREGAQIPVLISGSLDNPSFTPDVNAVLQQAITNPQQFKEQLQNSRKDLKEQLKDPKAAIKDIKGLLKGLRKQD